MKTFSVFEPPVLPGTLEDDAQSLVFVRHGWSLAALLIPLVWMAMRRMWWVLLAYVVLVIAVQLVGLVLAPLVTVMASVALAIIIMLEAGQLRLETMAAKGYREVAVLQAKNLREAENIYFAQWADVRETASQAVAERTPVYRPSSATPPALPGMS